MKNLASSKLTSKFQATVPKMVREALHLSAKDQIVYEVLEDQTEIVRRASPLDKAYLKGLDHSLNEWNSDEDEKAYKDLYSNEIIHFRSPLGFEKIRSAR